MSDDFDRDLARVDQIRRAQRSARPTHANPAWLNSHHDCDFLLSFIDKLWKEYTNVLRDNDADDMQRRIDYWKENPRG
jgi:hypothetical protein